MAIIPFNFNISFSALMCLLNLRLNASTKGFSGIIPAGRRFHLTTDRWMKLFLGIPDRVYPARGSSTGLRFGELSSKALLFHNRASCNSSEGWKCQHLQKNNIVALRNDLGSITGLWHQMFPEVFVRAVRF